MVDTKKGHLMETRKAARRADTGGRWTQTRGQFGQWPRSFFIRGICTAARSRRGSWAAKHKSSYERLCGSSPPPRTDRQCTVAVGAAFPLSRLNARPITAPSLFALTNGSAPVSSGRAAGGRYPKGLAAARGKPSFSEAAAAVVRFTRCGGSGEGGSAAPRCGPRGRRGWKQGS